MLKVFEFCVPTTGTKVPAGAEWLHKIKYDGYRLRVERGVDRVRLTTRGGCLDEAVPLDCRSHPQKITSPILSRFASVMGSPPPRPFIVGAVIDFGAMRTEHLLLSRANDLAEMCEFGLEGPGHAIGHTAADVKRFGSRTRTASTRP